MSKLTDKILEAGLVDESMAVEDLEKELSHLRELVSSSTPYCPHCKAKMESVEFVSYYDKFGCWECNCDPPPNAKTIKGDYA